MLQAAEADESIDLAACTAFALDEYFSSYFYGTEHLAHDGPISTLLLIEKAIKAMRQHLADEPWGKQLKGIDVELNRLGAARGAFPMFGWLIQQPQCDDPQVLCGGTLTGLILAVQDEASITYAVTASLISIFFSSDYR